MEPWMQEQLKAQLGFSELLPVQKVVIPFVDRVIRSMFPFDTCLSAPTGSGKTLCYLIPMIQDVVRAHEMGLGTQLRALVLTPSAQLSQQVYRIAHKLVSGKKCHIALLGGTGDKRKALANVVKTIKVVAADQQHGDEVPSDSTSTKPIGDSNDTAASSALITQPLSTEEVKLAVADIIISTPQQLLKYLTAPGGLPLSFLKMIVIDEADAVLNGTFTNVAARIISYHESCRAPGVTLHKMLCSATMTTHIAKVAEISLRNATYFTLDTAGKQAPVLAVDSEQGTAGSTAGTLGVTQKFSMPLRLYEHWLSIEAPERHVVFLKLVRSILRGLTASKEGAADAKPNGESEVSGVAAEESKETEKKKAKTAVTTSTDANSPKGKAILVFCSTAETVRVMCAFLQAAGLPSLEFASATTENERKKAVLQAFTGKNTIIVTTDALMRGIDLPGVAAVIMYDAPRTLQQYIHRTGRTARANCVGHSYALLTRLGPSGSKEDGEITVFKSFASYLVRHNNIQHERQLQAIDEDHINEANELLSAAKLMLKQSVLLKSAVSLKPAAGPRASKRPRQEEKVA
jgi:superfamily II DNA/RNA helicase